MLHDAYEPARRAVVLMIVLVCLGVSGVLMAVAVQTAASGRRAMQTALWAVQAEWLAQAGLERAAARMAADPDYAGESWSLSADELQGSDGAMVRIEVEPVGGRPEARRVCVQADFPDDAQYRARRNKETVLKQE